MTTIAPKCVRPAAAEKRRRYAYTGYLRLALPLLCWFLLLPAAAAGGRAYGVQAAAYRDAAAAASRQAGFQARGHGAFTRREAVGGRGTWYRVYLGPFAGRAQAVDAAERFKSEGLLSWYAVRETEADPVGGRTGSYAVQIAAYRDRTAAAGQAGGLRQKGYDAFFVRVVLKEKGVWYRVFLGSYRSRSEAAAAAGRLKALSGISGYTIRKLDESLPKEFPPSGSRDKDVQNRPEKPPSAIEKAAGHAGQPPRTAPAPTKALLREVAFEKAAEGEPEVISVAYSGRAAPWVSFYLDEAPPVLVAVFPEAATAGANPITTAAGGDWVRSIAARYDPNRRRTELRAVLAEGYVYRTSQAHHPERGRFEIRVSPFAGAGSQ